MDQALEIMTRAVEVVGAASVALAALYAMFLVVPGDQPDKSIKALLDFTTRFSRK